MSTDPAHFDRLYAADPDPWGFETSPYERAKMETCLGLLPPRSFDAGLEVGCSIGVFSERLAPLCGTFLGLDVAQAAIARARSRHIPNAQFRIAHLPRNWPSGSWDLIVLSEVLYFLDAQDISGLAERVAATLAPSGCVLLCTYLGPTETETELGGAEAERLFLDRIETARRLRPYRAVEETAFSAMCLETQDS